MYLFCGSERKGKADCPRFSYESRDGSTDGLRKIAVLEELVCHKLAVASAGCGIRAIVERLATEIG